MRWLSSVVALAVWATGVSAQAPLALAPEAASVFAEEAPSVAVSSPGARAFPNFIGFMSNPVQSIDPRSLTQVWPVFASTWVSPAAPLPAGDIQVYGAGLNVALTDRLSFGLNQGGYVTSDFGSRVRRVDLGLVPRANKDRRRDGWLDLGGFVQYTLIEDVPKQFLVTVGTRIAAPTGESEVFQGHGPAALAPYLTVAKELGDLHFLATAGYQFPFGGGGKECLETIYANFHLDYRVRGWIYPLVELNNSFLTSSYNPKLLVRQGFFDLGNFESTGTLVTVAAGVNLALVPNRVELGAVYITPIYTQRDFGFDGLLAKMILRF